MKSISKILVVLVVALSNQNTYAQIKNAQTVNLKIYGSCEMCESTIEKAGNVKNTAQVDWNKDTKMATLTYDSKKTNTDEILKRVALVGYDSEKFLAPDDVYAKLPECCQYTRELKPAAQTNMQATSGHGHHDAAATIQKTQLQAMLDSYFLLKDALVNTDAAAAAQKATALTAAVKAVEMDKLSATEHTVWMKVMKDLSAGAESIAAAKDIAKQRAAFALLAKPVYDLAKVTNYGSALYYQHCPMYNGGKGGNWLSKDEAVKNPFYGSQMLTCGSVQETIHGK